MKEYSYKEMYLINKFEKKLLENTMNKVKEPNKINQDKPILKDTSTETIGNDIKILTPSTINETGIDDKNIIQESNNETNIVTNELNSSNLSPSQKRRIRKRRNEQIVNKSHDKSSYDAWNLNNELSIQTRAKKKKAENSRKEKIKKKSTSPLKNTTISFYDAKNAVKAMKDQNKNSFNKW